MSDDKKNLKKLVKDQSALVKSDPNNLVARLKLAGALKDIGRGDEAVEHYTEVAKAYAASGKLVQAISVYKGILELRPRDAGIHAALTALNAKRAEEIQSKSVPRLQQADGRWGLPAGSEAAPEDQGTDQNTARRPTSSSMSIPTPSVLRLPAPVQEALSGRRGRRSRMSFSPDEVPGSAPRGPDSEPPPPAEAVASPGVPAQRMGGPGGGAGGAVDASLPRLYPARIAAQGSERPGAPGPTGPRPIDRVRMPEEPPELPTAERAPVAPRTPHAGGPPGEPELMISAEAPEDWAIDEGVEDESEEETTSPGGSTYNDTIRKSAVGLAEVPEAVAVRSKAAAPPRRTLVGMPLPEQLDRLPAEPTPAPDRPTPPRPIPAPLLAMAASDAPMDPARGLPAAPKPAPAPSGLRMPSPPGFATPVPHSGVEPATTEIMPVSPRTGLLLPPPPAEAETLGEVFSDDEEAIWSGLSRSGPRPGSEAPVAPAPLAAAPSAPEAEGVPSPLKAPVPAVSAPPAGGAVLARITLTGGRLTSPSPAASTRISITELPAVLSAPVSAPVSPTPAEPPAEPVRSPAAAVSAGPAPVEAAPFNIEQVDLFKGLCDASSEALRSRIVKRTEKPGAVIVREGDPGNALFVVSSGSVIVTKAGADGQAIELATLGAGSFFGEFALLSDRKRHATVTAVQESVLYEISRKVISDLTKSDPVFGNTLRQFYRQRLLDTLLNSAPFFQPLSAEERESLMGRLRFRRVPENTRIVTEGEPGGGFFLILIGEVEVSRLEPDQSRKVLARLGDGSYFGEMSLLKGGNAVATVTTRTPTEIVQLAASEFYRLLSNYPQIWQEVNQESERRELANLQILSGRSPRSTSHDTGVVM